MSACDWTVEREANWLLVAQWLGGKKVQNARTEHVAL